jgi:hypothetical protein
MVSISISQNPFVLGSAKLYVFYILSNFTDKKDEIFSK